MCLEKCSFTLQSVILHRKQIFWTYVCTWKTKICCFHCLCFVTVPCLFTEPYVEDWRHPVFGTIKAAIFHWKVFVYAYCFQVRQKTSRVLFDLKHGLNNFMFSFVCFIIICLCFLCSVRVVELNLTRIADFGVCCRKYYVKNRIQRFLYIKSAIL